MSTFSRSFSCSESGADGTEPFSVAAMISISGIAQSELPECLTEQSILAWLASLGGQKPGRNGVRVVHCRAPDKVEHPHSKYGIRDNL